MQYIAIVGIILLVLIWLIKSSIKYGWIFLILGLVGFGISMTLLSYGPVNAVFGIIFGVCSISCGAAGMVWKINWNERRTLSAQPLPYELCSQAQHGFVFGTSNQRHIIKPEERDGHILVVGGVGSGKSSCLAIPSLRRWQARVFAIDIKGELYTHTKDFRPNIKVFDPRDKSSYGYDPYMFIRTSTNPAQEARAIAQTLIPLPPDTKNPFWIKSAQTIFTAAILHFYTDFSFVGTIKRIQSIVPRELISVIHASHNEKARLIINNFVGLKDETLSEIFAEVSGGIIRILEDDELVSALSRDNNIAPDDLENFRDIYIEIPAENISQWKDLLTLIVSQFIRFFERRGENPNNMPILFLIDEFARLGKFNDISNGLATLRSKKITFCIIIQSLPQLDDIYGRNTSKVICDTCSYQAVLSVSEADSQDTFSRLVGTYEKQQPSKGQSFMPGLGIPLGRNEQETTVDKRKIKPEDFATLVRDKKLVLITPLGNFVIDKRAYWE